MARKAKTEKEKKRAYLCDKYSKVRKQLKDIVNSALSSYIDKQKATDRMCKLPRDSSKCRKRNRCMICGRSRGINRFSGLCRIHMRELINGGFFPGIRKSSW